MQALFGQGLSPEDAALFSNFPMNKLNDNVMVVTAPVRSHPPPPLEPGQSSDGTSSTATHNNVAQAAKQAEATAYIKATENIQRISDDDYVPCEDDLCSTDESIGDDEMEARQASAKPDETNYVKRITRKSNKWNQPRKSTPSNKQKQQNPNHNNPNQSPIIRYRHTHTQT